MDAVWSRDAVKTTLKRRQLAGQGPVSLMELQQLVGLGPGDLNVAVGLLVDDGSIRALGEGTSLVYDLPPEQEEAAVEPAEESASPWADAAPAPIPAADAAPEAAAQVGSGRAPDGVPRELRLTAHVAMAVDSDTLGAMVLAGVIEAAEAGAPFTLVVTP